MPDSRLFLMAGGGTGGHVIPAIAVARELEKRGHRAVFVGTERGVEARLVPKAGFPLEFIRVGGVMGLGLVQKMISAGQLVTETLAQARRFGSVRPDAVFSMGGYVAGPPVLAAILRRIPILVMEPNAVPGFMNRMTARFVRRALISFRETERYFPSGRTELTGLPVREDFFHLAPKPVGNTFTILITGGSQGSRTLNEAASASWPLFRKSGLPVRFLHQTGLVTFEKTRAEFLSTGLEGEVSAFFQDMPAVFAQADLIVCRSGAGAVAELAAAGKPSILIPFPFATGQHQLRNAEAFERAGAARLVLDKEWTGEQFFNTVSALIREPGELAKMAAAARELAHPGAARRAADILEEIH
ncbi:MAG: UDP-N-acetylglucosamine--N-acetylmuramyl-(pentapeptide) pyrophosphoryl-undecaprenol [Bryobacterales bacterium]|nr:UDP-N-acetylglucosamine--N-acetylmuramyl-(pentapeptide) pyrophosphoryl-undecaprenol [Bryobacterales bacterium]